MNLMTRGTLFIVLFLSHLAAISAADTRHRLAILIAAPWAGETAMRNDMLAIRDALRQRGYSANEIMALDAHVDRQSLFSLLQDARRRIAGWKDGEVFLYFSGHGYYSGSTVADARPGLALAAESSNNSAVFWDEVFAALKVPATASLIVLPDS